MQKVRGYAFAVEWSWRRKCGIFGRNWYSLDYRLEEFMPFSNVFEARAAEKQRCEDGARVAGFARRSFIFELDLAISEGRKEEAEVTELGSLVVFSRPRFGDQYDRRWWKIFGGGRDFLVRFKPYAHAYAALRTLERERDRGQEARLASWKMRQLTRDTVSVAKIG